MKNKEIIKKNNNTEANKNKFLGILAIINKHFWKSFVGPFFAFGYPIIFVAILGTIFGYEMILGSTITIGPVAIACISLPTAIFEFKKSTILKRIGASSIKPKSFLAYTAIFYLIIMICSGLWTMLVALMFFCEYFKTGRSLGTINNIKIGEASLNITLYGSSIKEMFSRIFWPGYIFSFVIIIFVSISVGLFIISVSKSVLTIQAIGCSLLIITMFLSGQVLPISQISNIKGMWYVSYLTPFKSAIIQNTISFQGQASLSNEYNIASIKATLNIGNEIKNIDLLKPFSTADSSNKIYTIEELQKYIEGVAKYANLLKEANSKQDPIAKFTILKFLNQQKDLFLANNNALPANTPIGIKYSQYNIFNINNEYKTLNILNVYQPVILKYSTIAEAFNQNGLDQLLKNNEFANYFKFLDSSYIQFSNNVLSNDSLTKIGSKTENLLNFILPWIWIVILSLLSIKTFAWNTR